MANEHFIGILEAPKVSITEKVEMIRGFSAKKIAEDLCKRFKDFKQDKSDESMINYKDIKISIKSLSKNGYTCDINEGDYYLLFERSENGELIEGVNTAYFIYLQRPAGKKEKGVIHEHDKKPIKIEDILKEIDKLKVGESK